MKLSSLGITQISFTKLYAYIIYEHLITHIHKATSNRNEPKF